MIREFLEWRRMKRRNKELAAKEGYFYLDSRADIMLLKQVISEINKNDELTALFRTSDGATLSLRVAPHYEPDKKINRYEGGAE